jgi:hypothetical protein
VTQGFRTTCRPPAERYWLASQYAPSKGGWGFVALLRCDKPGAARQPPTFLVSPRKVGKRRRPRGRWWSRGFGQQAARLRNGLRLQAQTPLFPKRMASREARQLALRAQTSALLYPLHSSFFRQRPSGTACSRLCCARPRVATISATPRLAAAPTHRACPAANSCCD